MPQLVHNYTTFIFWSKHLHTTIKYTIKDTIKDSVYTRITSWLRKPPVEGIGKIFESYTWRCATPSTAAT